MEFLIFWSSNDSVFYGRHPMFAKIIHHTCLIHKLWSEYTWGARGILPISILRLHHLCCMDLSLAANPPIMLLQLSYINSSHRLFHTSIPCAGNQVLEWRINFRLPCAPLHSIYHLHVYLHPSLHHPVHNPHRVSGYSYCGMDSAWNSRKFASVLTSWAAARRERWEERPLSIFFVCKYWLVHFCVALSLYPSLSNHPHTTYVIHPIPIYAFQVMSAL